MHTHNDLLDLPPVAKDFLARDPKQHIKMVEQMAGMAAVALNKWSLIEATASALHTYAQAMDWTPQLEPNLYEEISPSSCCKHGRLPVQVVEAVRGYANGAAES